MLASALGGRGVVGPEAVLVLGANLGLAASLFLTEDQRAARRLAEEKEQFRTIELAAMQAHFAALRGGRGGLAEVDTLHLDLIRDLKRVNAHLVEAAAYPVLRSAGALLPTRVAPEP
ncbi:hypothetical protein QMO56_02675 [Roseomonas sp. E05]|uniref:hypothetical protein n=1 Tax=Roseomonas sp. E05 TaxID=3046310 RepID=UPI0024B9D0DF|nr:hypothetical protein [Roseomonas sp. E05]MDJ0387006.1 hypothetical protein [Roseomonas sp. E05]